MVGLGLPSHAPSLSFVLLDRESRTSIFASVGITLFPRERQRLPGNRETRFGAHHPPPLCCSPGTLPGVADKKSLARAEHKVGCLTSAGHAPRGVGRPYCESTRRAELAGSEAGYVRRIRTTPCIREHPGLTNPPLTFATGL